MTGLSASQDERIQCTSGFKWISCEAKANCFTNLFPVDLILLLEIMEPRDCMRSRELRRQELHNSLTTTGFTDCALTVTWCHPT